MGRFMKQPKRIKNPEISQQSRENICAYTAQIDELNIHSNILKTERNELSTELSRIGYNKDELERLSELSDTGSSSSEHLRNELARREYRKLVAVLRLLRRDPRSLVDITIEAIRQEADRQLRDIRRFKLPMVRRIADINDELRENNNRVRQIELDMDQTGRVARANGCDMNYVNQWCPSNSRFR